MFRGKRRNKFHKKGVLLDEKRLITPELRMSMTTLVSRRTTPSRVDTRLPEGPGYLTGLLNGRTGFSGK